MVIVVVGQRFQNESGPTMDVSIFVETTFDGGETANGFKDCRLTTTFCPLSLESAESD